MADGVRTFLALREKADADPGSTIGINPADLESLRGLNVDAWRAAPMNLGPVEADATVSTLNDDEPDFSVLNDLLGVKLKQDAGASPLVPGNEG
jgi:hypothetical protein